MKTNQTFVSLKITETQSSLPEKEIRELRDFVYQQKSSDSNWRGCCEAWMREEEVKWLKEQKELMDKKQEAALLTKV